MKWPGAAGLGEEGRVSNIGMVGSLLFDSQTAMNITRAFMGLTASMGTVVDSRLKFVTLHDLMQ